MNAKDVPDVSEMFDDRFVVLKDYYGLQIRAMDTGTLFPVKFGGKGDR